MPEFEPRSAFALIEVYSRMENPPHSKKKSGTEQSDDDIPAGS